MSAIRPTIILLALLLGTFKTVGAETRSVPADLRQRIVKLPAKLSELYRTREIDLSGSTVSMAEALDGISNGLLEDAVVLQAFVTGQTADQVRREIQRDQEAIARGIDYKRNAEGWGGSITVIKAADAALTHVENLISYYVTRIFEKDESFDIKNWYIAWRKAAKRNN